LNNREECSGRDSWKPYITSLKTTRLFGVINLTEVGVFKANAQKMDGKEIMKNKAKGNEKFKKNKEDRRNPLIEKLERISGNEGTNEPSKKTNEISQKRRGPPIKFTCSSLAARAEERREAGGSTGKGQKEIGDEIHKLWRGLSKKIVAKGHERKRDTKRGRKGKLRERTKFLNRASKNQRET